MCVTCVELVSVVRRGGVERGRGIADFEVVIGRWKEREGGRGIDKWKEGETERGRQRGKEERGAFMCALLTLSIIPTVPPQEKAWTPRVMHGVGQAVRTYSSSVVSVSTSSWLPQTWLGGASSSRTGRKRMTLSVNTVVR